MADSKGFLDSPAGRIAAGVGLALLAREAIGRLREADLRGEVALITGGSRGLGLLLARHLAAEGCRIVICARDVEELQRAEDDLRRRGADVLAVKADVTVRSDVEHLVKEATEHFGRVDILVNNAGVIATGPVATMTPQDFADMMEVMFWSNVFTTWEVLPQMRARHSGRIVNITSIGGKVSVPHLLPYSAAKFAAVGFSEGMHAELKKDGITVTTVVPGLMRTGSYLNAFVKGQKEKEFILFGAVDNIPGISISAESAAKSIVRAIKRGKAETVLSLPAKAMALFHGVFPGAMSDLMGIVNGFLPDAEGGSDVPERAMDVQERVGKAKLADPLGLGRAAANDLHQYPGPVHHNGDGVPARAAVGE